MDEEGKVSATNGVFLGTPLEEAESCLLSRKQPLTNRAPRVWEQIVTDERGRRRLHGAFTGGFSAGYFNTVDTKEGFTPKSFRTSRSQRAEDQKQEIHDFYDKDELEDLHRVRVVAQDAYDTFSSAANEKIKERTEMEDAAHPIIPGGLIDEFVESVPESIGVKLLQRMGWRQGKGIGEAFKSATESVIELGWGPEASVMDEGVKIWNEKPKMNVHGLGFDPFCGFHDFARLKERNTLLEKQPTSKRSRGIAFGVGVLEETDTFGEMVDYVDTMQRDKINYYDMSDESDDGKISKQSQHQEIRRLQNKPRNMKEGDESFVPGFCISTVLKELKTFQLPVVPPHFTGKLKPTHAQQQDERAAQDQSINSTVPTPRFPADLETKKIIDSVAVFVARSGYLSEELIRKEHTNDKKYAFLFNGDGSDYYRWKLLDVKVTFQKLGVDCIGQREAPLTADDRGFLLGDEKLKEEPTSNTIKSQAVSHPAIETVPEADRSRVRSALLSNFVKGSAETALQTEKVIPGLREAKPQDPISQKKESVTRAHKATDSCVPVRWFVDWHPAPLLYKRFNIADPYRGQAREPEIKSKFMSYEAQMDEGKTNNPSSSVAAPVISIADEVDITLPPPEYTEPPIDIFKSIFDASDNEEEEKTNVQTGQQNQQASSTKDERKEPMESSSPARSPKTRKRLKLSSDESSEDESAKRVPQGLEKEGTDHQDSGSESIDESLFAGLSTSEFKKLLKTLKKGQKKKHSSRKKHKRKHGKKKYKSKV